MPARRAVAEQVQDTLLQRRVSGARRRARKFLGRAGNDFALKPHKTEKLDRQVVPGGISGGSSAFRMGDCLEMPEGYAALGGAPIDVIEGILTIGLSSVSGHRPLIWRDGDVEEIDVNGYICTVSSMPFR